MLTPQSINRYKKIKYGQRLTNLKKPLEKRVIFQEWSKQNPELSLFHPSRGPNIPKRGYKSLKWKHWTVLWGPGLTKAFDAVRLIKARVLIALFYSSQSHSPPLPLAMPPHHSANKLFIFAESMAQNNDWRRSR